MLRPAIASERLTWTDDGRLRYRLKRRFDDGTESVLFQPEDFVSKLVPLVPRPRKNEILYYGVLAPAAKHRAQIIFHVPDATAASPASPIQLRLFPAAARRRQISRSATARRSFAQLMRHTFAIDVETCSACGRGPLRCLGIVTDPETIQALLATASPDTQESFPRIPWARGPPPHASTQLALPFAA